MAQAENPTGFIKALSTGLVELTSEAIVAIDDTQQILFINPAAEKMLGCKAEEAPGLLLSQFIPTLNPATAKEALRVDGSRFPIEGSLCELTVNGRPVQAVTFRDISQRRQDESAQRLLASIVDSSSDAIVSKDLNGTVLSWNRGAERMFGFSAEELVGRSIKHIIPESRLHEEEMIIKTIARGALLEHFETERRCKDGRLIPVSVTVSPIRDSSGIIIGASKVARDISQRRALDENLRRSEELYRSIVETADEGVWQVDANHRTTFVNARMAEILGCSAEEMTGHSELDFLDTSTHQLITANLDRRKLGLKDVYTLCTHRRDGSEVWLSIRSNPLRDANGGFAGTLAMITDITERKRAEVRLQASNERFRHLTQSLPQLIWTCDAQGVCEFLSEQWVRYTGVPAEQQLGKGWLDLIHAEDQARLIEVWTRSVQTGADFHCEFRIRRYDGAYRWFDARGTPECDSNGKIIRWYGANTDIETEKRARDTQMRNQKMEALGTLSGGIAHDFNNILLAITGNTALALEDLPPDHSATQSLRDIDAASRRAADLVRRILAFSRQDEPRRQTMSLQPVLEEVMKLLRATVPAQIELRVRYDANTPTTICDPTQVHQIVMNLVTNAVFAIGARAGFVEITLESSTVEEALPESTLRAGRYARLTVADNGCGMTRSTQARIFDPFFTTKPEGVGTGLGLSVVDGIMKTHGGAITVYSEVGRGSVFRLYFPATDERVELVPDKRASDPKGQGQRVMYVDDDELLLSLARRKLTRLGYEVTEFSDPQAALEAFASDCQRFDVVVTDLSMPRMSGFDLARQLLEVRGDIPIIVTSGHVRPDEHALAREIGVHEVLLKPSTADELGRVLDQVLKRP